MLLATIPLLFALCKSQTIFSESGIDMEFSLDIGNSTSTLTISCNIVGVWFGIVLDATQMASGQTAVIYGGTSHLTSIMDYPQISHNLGSSTTSAWTLTGSTINGTKTTITMTRDNAATGDHPELNSSATSMNVIWARGADTNVAYHGAENRMSETVSAGSSNNNTSNNNTSNTNTSKTSVLFPNVWFMVICIFTAFNISV